MPLLNDLKFWGPFMFSARHPECISDIHGCLTAYDCVRIYLTAKGHRHETMSLTYYRIIKVSDYNVNLS